MNQNLQNLFYNYISDTNSIVIYSANPKIDYFFLLTGKESLAHIPDLLSNGQRFDGELSEVVSFISNFDYTYTYEKLLHQGTTLKLEINPLSELEVYAHSEGASCVGQIGAQICSGGWMWECGNWSNQPQYDNDPIHTNWAGMGQSC